MQLLWLFFILSNLFYVFYFDENVFYFILFSVLFLPNFFNTNFYAKQVSLFQYVHFLRTNLSSLLLFFASTKSLVKSQLSGLFSSKDILSGYYSTIGLISLFKFLAKRAIIQLEKKSLHQDLALVDSFLLLFFQNNDNFFNVFEKKKIIANIGASETSFSKTDKMTGQFVLNVLNAKYKTGDKATVFSAKEIRKIFSLLENKK